MTRSKAFLVLAAALATFTTSVSARGPVADDHAQGSQAKAAPAPYSSKIDVVIERYQGDKKISSMPFMLRTANGSGSLRVGVDVPIGNTTQTRETTSGNSNR